MPISLKYSVSLFLSLSHTHTLTYRLPLLPIVLGSDCPSMKICDCVWLVSLHNLPFKKMRGTKNVFVSARHEREIQTSVCLTVYLRLLFSKSEKFRLNNVRSFKLSSSIRYYLDMFVLTVIIVCIYFFDSTMHKKKNMKSLAVWCAELVRDFPVCVEISAGSVGKFILFTSLYTVLAGSHLCGRQQRS